ncbi:GMC oxidoreductase [Peribacillus sp. NPDC096622]|uniref:GMC oxidoreductase n=1 Tax=Peribacillus sp. NPDC096622 TaxID=3364396 RepID=UPI003806FB5D
MRIHVADNFDTLRSIAIKHKIDLPDILALNPLIPEPDQNISGIAVKLPTKFTSIKDKDTCLGVIPAPISEGAWIPLTTLDEMAQNEYDVLIIGSGAGGGAVLWRLCSQWGINNKRIGIIEAGDLLIPTNAHNIATMGSKHVADYFLKSSFPVANTGFREVIALGGRMLFWNGISPRMHLHTFGKWPVPVNEMTRYFNIAEQSMNVTQEYTAGSHINKVLLDRLWENGWVEAMNTPLAADLQSTKDGELHSNVFFSTILYFARALNYRSFDLAVKARALRVIVENNKAVAVEVMSLSKKSYFLKAKTIIMAASTIQTPRILLHSGITGIALGHYLSGHSYVTTYTRINKSYSQDVLGPVSILIPETNVRPYQVSIENYLDQISHGNQRPFKDQHYMALYGMVTAEPRFENQIILDSRIKDEYGLPAVNVDFTLSERDKSIQQQAEKILKKIVSDLGMPINEITRITSLGHLASGTCRMGLDPAVSATDLNGQIHGVSGLYVADNSVLPWLGAANPTLTTIALAIRTADHIIGQLK